MTRLLRSPLVAISLFSWFAAVVSAAPDEASFRGGDITVQARVFEVPVTELIALFDRVADPKKEPFDLEAMAASEAYEEVATIETRARAEKPWGRVREGLLELDFEMVILGDGKWADMLGIFEGDGYELQFDGGLRAGEVALVGSTTQFRDGEPHYLAFFILAAAGGGTR